MSAVFDIVGAVSANDTPVVVAIFGARILLPLLIPRYPLAIVGALVLDAADNSLLARYTDVDLGPDGPYQSFDKALDIYYLAIAYLSAYRNWTSDAAIRTAQFLFYYRLIGVMAFELTGTRALLLVFPNTFEYFFIAYELIRTRFEPSRRSARAWVLIAAAIWVFVKLPQEYWIHVAQLDFTDAVANHPAFGALCLVGVIVGLGILQFVVRPRLPMPDWSWRFGADPLPASVADIRGRRAHRLLWGRSFWHDISEKVLLLALLVSIFAQILPDVDAGVGAVAVGVLVTVSANAALSTFAARRGTGVESDILRFLTLLGLNFALAYVVGGLLIADDDFPLFDGLFLAFLGTLVIWLYDVFRPVYDVRFDGSPLHIESIGDFTRRVRSTVP